MITILADLFQSSNKEEIDKICYFLVGNITADYKDIQIGMGEQMTKSSISLALDLDESEVDKKFQEIGDLGDLAEQVEREPEEKFSEFHEIKELTVKKVHEGLMKIAKTCGENSQEIMKKTLAAILSHADPCSRKYIIRLVLGQMRLGVGDMTVLDGLAQAYLGSKDKRPPLEHAYNVSSDIGYVAKILAKSGLDGVKRIRVAINRPLRPQLAQRVDTISEIREKIGSEEIAAEEKYDGERIQAHKDGENVRLFSRRLNEITHQFPEIVENVGKYVESDSAILDGEAVAYDFEEKEYKPFQKIMNRRRKYDVEEYAKKIPVKYMVFDLIYLNGSSFLRRNYKERTKKLHEVLDEHEYIEPTGRIISDNIDEIDEYFQDCINRGLEGVICKSTGPSSYYRAGAREWSWIKWKPSYASELSDTLDLVVVGSYAGKGKRAGTFGSLLCACYNHEEDVYETVCKLGTGFTDKQLDELPGKLSDAQVNKKPARLHTTDDVEPDNWYIPKYVFEVKGGELTESPVHTCNWDSERERGLGLRFPRFERWRPDKSSDQATTTSEIVRMKEG